jgi:large subunit ribosomal protein L35
LNSHKSGKRIRRLRKSTQLKVTAEARRVRFALIDKQNVNPQNVHAEKLAALAEGAGAPGAGAATDPKKVD